MGARRLMLFSLGLGLVLALTYMEELSASLSVVHGHLFSRPAHYTPSTPLSVQAATPSGAVGAAVPASAPSPAHTAGSAASAPSAAWCASAADAAPPLPLWRSAGAGTLPRADRQLLMALDTHLAPYQCTAGSRVALVGMGCTFAAPRPTAAALATLGAVRAGLPQADLSLVDPHCDSTSSAAATASLSGVTWRGFGDLAKGSYAAVAIRGDYSGAGGGDMLGTFSAYFPLVAAGGVLLTGGMGASYAAGDGYSPGTLAGFLTQAMDYNHCRPDMDSARCSGAGFPEQQYMLPLIKAVDCSPGHCAVLLYAPNEIAHLTDKGAYAAVLRGQLPALREELKAQGGSGGSACAPTAWDSETLWKLGLGTGTDKVADQAARGSTHWYHETYTRHMGRRRCSIRNALEIGLGCDMHYSPGAAFSMWLDFLPAAHVAYMEYDGACVDKFNREDPKGLTAQFGAERWSLYQGDQLKASDLLAVHAARGDWDLLIDDGGHTMLMQILTLQTLLPKVQPGGLYALEDFHTSYIDWVKKDGVEGVLVKDYFVMLTRELHTPGAAERSGAGGPGRKFEGVAALAPTIKSVDCTPQCCMITKWSIEETEFLAA